MKAVIYTRFSTDKQDSSSTAAQIRNCNELIKRENWTLVGTYGDEGISGSDNHRPDYQRLQRDSEAGQFDVIVVDDTSRLTRAPGELQHQLEWLNFRGQQLVDCRGFDSRDSSASMQAAIGGLMDEQYIEKVRHWTRRGQREVVMLDLNPGGRAFGYSSEPVQTEGKRRWRVVIVEEQAEVVREIFELYRAGRGLKAIADSLNRRGVPSPGSTWNRTRRRCGGWMHSAVRVILRNDRYTGKLTWNKTKWIKVPFSSKRKRMERPLDEWVIREVPALEIVPPALWLAVQRRFDTPSRRAQSKAQKKQRGRPPRHLLSGLMVCSECGANMVIESRGRYACSSRTNGGKHACSNQLRVDGNVAEDALLAGICDELLSDEAVKLMQRRVRERLRESTKQSQTPNVDRLVSELREIEPALQRVADAIESVGISATLAKRLRVLEQNKAELTDKIAEARKGQPAATALPDIIPGLIDKYRKLVTEIATLSRNPSTTRQNIEKARSTLSALVGRIRVEPRGDVLVATPTINAAGLVRSSAAINRSFVVAGAGFEPATFGL